MSTDSPGINFVVDEHEHFGQYDPHKLSSERMPFYNYPATLKNKNEIPTELPC